MLGNMLGRVCSRRLRRGLSAHGVARRARCDEWCRLRILQPWSICGKELLRDTGTEVPGFGWYVGLRTTGGPRRLGALPLYTPVPGARLPLLQRERLACVDAIPGTGWRVSLVGNASRGATVCFSQQQYGDWPGTPPKSPFWHRCSLSFFSAFSLQPAAGSW